MYRQENHRHQRSSEIQTFLSDSQQTTCNWIRVDHIWHITVHETQVNLTRRRHFHHLYKGLDCYALAVLRCQLLPELFQAWPCNFSNGWRWQLAIQAMRRKLQNEGQKGNRIGNILILRCTDLRGRQANSLCDFWSCP